MCKIIVLTDASKIENFDLFSRYCADILYDMRDGYGYAAQGQDGVFGHRTTSPNLYALNTDIPTFCESPGLDFGTKSKVKGAAIFHGRTSTNSVSLINTHPIVRDNWFLIHNGVVTDHGPKYDMLTTNDSEHVLKHLITGGIETVATNLTGYYAGAVLTPNGQLHVFRDAIAQLYYAYSKKLGCGIFATTIDLIADIGDYVKENLTAVKVKDNTYLVYSESKLVETKQFTSRGYDEYSSKLSHKSLGHSITIADDDDEHYRGMSYSEGIPIDFSELDDSYTYHHGFKELSFEEFMGLDYYDQVDCEIRKNGFVVDWSLIDAA